MADETKIIRIIVDSSKAVDGSSAATRALEKLERSAASIETTMGKMQAGVERVGVYLKAQLALMVADLGARFVQMAKDSLTAVAGLDELAEQLGVTTAGLQALQYSAVQNGLKLEQLEGGVSKFSQKMGEAAGGSKEMVEALNALGVKNLDIQGKLRPTQELMTEVAAAIVKIEDPAKRSAAAVDFFGKAGARMLPMLKDIAGGFDDMAAKAQRGGAMISKEAIEKLDKLSDSAERGNLKMRALFAENAAGPLTETLDFITRKMENLAAIVKGVSLDFASLLKIAAGIASPGQLVGQLLSKSPAEKLASDLADARKRSAQAWDDLGSPNTSDRERPQIMSEYSRAQQRIAELERQQGVMNVGGKTGGGTPSDPDGIGLYVPPQSKGAATSAIKGAGAGEADKIAKLMRDTGRDLAAANEEAAVSERGARAVAELEVHYRALKAAQDAYGATADKNAASVGALTAKLEEQMRATERAKSLKDFNLGTEELEKANQILAAENGLINASVEVRSRELAIIKLKQDTLAKGLDENDPKERAAIDRRGEAIVQNERLKAQGEEIKRSNELWTEPLKTALSSIQSTAAGLFDSMLESGKFSFDELANVAKVTVRRMIAEFMALAIIRPMMGSLMGGLTSVGLVSPATASSLGYGGGSGGAGGAGGGFSMPSMGGGGSMFGFLNNPISPGSMPAGVYGPAQPGLGGMTWGQGIAGAASIGMGAYNLATSRSTAGKIGGGLSMLGGGIGMASAAGLLPMLGAAGGPIGMGLGMAGMLLPMLFGGGESAPLPPLSGGNVQFDPTAGGYSMNATQQNGGNSIGGQFAGVGTTLDAFFKRAGGITNAGNAFGAAIWNNQREGTTSTYLMSPTQGSNQQTFNESGDPAKAVDRLIAKVFYNSIQNNAAMNASPTLRTAFGNREPTSTAQVAALLDLIDSYDKLGKQTVSAKDALEQINGQFAALTAGANEWGLSLAPIVAEQGKVTKRFAQDFIDNMLDPVAVQMRALDDQRKDSLASAQYIADNVKDVYVDMAKVAEYWTKKERDLKEQAYEASVSSLQALIKRLTYGDLANASPDTSYSGTRAAYTSTLAQARAGSTSAMDNLAGVAETYATSARTYFASSPEYAELVAQIRRDLEERVGAVGNTGGSSGGASNNEVTNAVLNSNAEMRSMVAQMANDNAALRDRVDSLIAQLARRP